MRIKIRSILVSVAFVGIIQVFLIAAFHPAPEDVAKTFAGLLLAHLIADFPLQADWVYRLKVCSLAGIAIHAGMHVLVTALILSDSLAYWPVLILVGLAHFVVDWLKPRWRGSSLANFLLDQMIHLATLITIAVLFPAQPGLPAALLYPALVYAMIPAALMGLWVLSCDRRSTSRRLRWMHYYLLRVSKAVGVPLVATLSLWLVIRG
jgi:hypothetical protein